MTITEVEEQILEEFQLFDDWMDKYSHIIEMGRSSNLIEEKFKNEQHLINGCQSRVWLHAVHSQGKVSFTADSDAVITRGLVNLLIRVLNNRTPDEILNAELGFIDKIGLKEHLSPTRSNGLTSMIKQMKLYAMAFKVKQ